MKLATWVSICGVVLAGLLTLAQLWWDPFSAEFFFKALVTIGIVVLVVVLASLIRDSYLKEKKFKRDRSLVD